MSEDKSTRARTHTRARARASQMSIAHSYVRKKTNTLQREGSVVMKQEWYHQRDAGRRKRYPPHPTPAAPPVCPIFLLCDEAVTSCCSKSEQLGTDLTNGRHLHSLPSSLTQCYGSWLGDNSITATRDATSWQLAGSRLLGGSLTDAVIWR